MDHRDRLLLNNYIRNNDGDISKEDIERLAYQLDIDIDLVIQYFEDTLVNEGVGDKYADKKFNIADPDEEFERGYSQHKLKTSGVKGDKPFAIISGKFAKDKSFPLFKNPKSMNGFPGGCRGVIMDNGDLYVVADAKSIIHTDILETLSDKGIVTYGISGWDDPTTLDKFRFVIIQQLWNKPAFTIGESYIIPKIKKKKNPETGEKTVDEKTVQEQKEILNLFEPYLESARIKNPQYKFINTQSRQAARDFLTPEELAEFKQRM